MPTACSTSGGFAKPRGTGSVTSFTQTGSTNFSVINKIKEMYEKPAAVLADWLRISERTAKRKLACQRPLSAEEIGHLIRSERGFEVITAIMAGHQPAWWRLCAPLMESADIRKMQIAAQKRVKKILGEAVDADQSLAAAIAQADALAFYGSEQAGLHADALRALSGTPHRAMASKVRRRP